MSTIRRNSVLTALMLVAAATASAWTAGAANAFDYPFNGACRGTHYFYHPDRGLPLGQDIDAFFDHQNGNTRYFRIFVTWNHGNNRRPMNNNPASSDNWASCTI